LSREQVTVVDQSGNVLNPDNKDVVLQAQQLDIAREINQRYERLLTDLLVPVLGRGNFRIASDADIDFSRSKESLVKYGQSHVLSQDETTHMHGDGEQAIGIPGALSNRRPDTPTVNPPPKPTPQAQTPDQAGAPGTAASGTSAPAAAPEPSDTHKTTNYDIDKTVEYLEHAPWRLRGINVAVLVNNPTGSPIPAERLQSINKLVASAIGAGQNPHVTVVDLPFEGSGSPAGPAEDLWHGAWMGTVAKNALLAVAGLFALFGGLFPLLRRLTGAQVAIAAAIRPPSLEAVAGMDMGDVKTSRNRAITETQDVFSIEADTVQTLVTHDPARTAQVIRGWIAGDRSSLR
jgi:flagellar M-ring protein FliF